MNLYGPKQPQPESRSVALKVAYGALMENTDGSYVDLRRCKMRQAVL